MTSLVVPEPQKFTRNFLLLTYGVSSLGLVDDTDPEMGLVAPAEDDATDYVACPQMGFELPALSGLLDRDPCQVLLPKTIGDAAWDSFIQNVLEGSPVYDLQAVIFQQITDDYGNTRTDVLFRGFPQGLFENPDNQDGTLRLEINTFAILLDVPAGMEASPTCWATYGGNGCFATVPRLTVTVVAITESEIQLRSAVATDVTGAIARWWENGFIERDGQRVKLQTWTQGTENFFTIGFAPQSWVGQQVILVGGCYKEPLACSERNNTPNFNGVGTLTPNYNPLFGDPLLR